MATPEDIALWEAREALDAAMRGYVQALKAGKGMPLEWLGEFVAEQARRFRLKELSDAVDSARTARNACDDRGPRDDA